MCRIPFLLGNLFSDELPKIKFSHHICSWISLLESVAYHKFNFSVVDFTLFHFICLFLRHKHFYPWLYKSNFNINIWLHIYITVLVHLKLNSYPTLLFLDANLDWKIDYAGLYGSEVMNIAPWARELFCFLKQAHGHQNQHLVCLSLFLSLSLPPSPSLSPPSPHLSL